MGLGKATISLTKFAFETWELPALPTWMVLGRSNVGKSSLLNALIHPQEIFRSGSTPGVTRGLVGANVQMGREAFFLLDLPGWGYSVRSKQEEKAWAILGTQLQESMNPEMTTLLWLVDSRRSFNDEERGILKWFGRLNWFFVFTKADQIKRSERREKEREWALPLEASTQAPLWVSVKSGEGIEELGKRAKSFVRSSVELRDSLKKK